MWNAHNYNENELKIVKELEYLLFMYNPGFRAMWHDNFREYFKGTQDEEYWERQERIRNKELEESTRQNMMNPEYASWRHELAIIEETFFGDSNESPIARSRWYEREQMLAAAQEESEQRDRKWKNDKLFKTAKDWGWQLVEISVAEYENTKNLDWFRIIQNCTMVAAKIVFASGDHESEIYNDPEMFPWRTDCAGYIMALVSLQRCLESLRQLQSGKRLNGTNKFIPPALEMQLELADRLDRIEQNYLKSNPLIKSNQKNKFNKSYYTTVYGSICKI